MGCCIVVFQDCLTMRSVHCGLLQFIDTTGWREQESRGLKDILHLGVGEGSRRAGRKGRGTGVVGEVVDVEGKR